MFKQLYTRNATKAIQSVRVRSSCISTQSTIVPANRAFHTNFINLKKDETSGEEVIELPKRGRMPVPKHVQELGDKFLALNAIENMILTEYVREKMGFAEDIPNPLSSMLRDAFGDLLLPGTPKYGVPADAMMLQQQQMMAQMMSQGAFAAPAAGGAQQAAAEQAPAEEEKKEEKTHYDIKLEKYDEANKIKIIKELRTIDKNLSIKAAKDAVEGAPSVIQSNVKKEDAEKIKAALEALGATIALV